MRIKKLNKIHLIIFVIFLIFIPSIIEIYMHKLPGNDPFEYALGGISLLGNLKTIYAYPYPLTDLLYLPSNYLNDYQVYIYATLMDSFALSILFISSLLYFSKRKKFTESIILSSLIIFAPLFLSEFLWGGQAQIFSLSMIFFSLYLIEKKSYLFILFIPLSIFFEPYSSIFGLIFIFLLNLYNKNFRFLILTFFIALFSYSYYIFNRISELVIPPYIEHIVFISIPPIWWLYIIFLTILIIYFYKKTINHIIFISIISFSSYLFITPYYDYPRIFYFAIIALVLSIDIDFNNIEKYKKMILSLILIFLILSYSNFTMNINHEMDMEKYYLAGTFINNNSLSNQSFLNVNVKNGWPLEFFAKREMLYASSDLKFLIFRDQINNSLIGKLISHSEYLFENNSGYYNNYLFIKKSDGFMIFRYDSVTNDFYKLLDFYYSYQNISYNDRFINFTGSKNFGFIELFNYSKIYIRNNYIYVVDKYNLNFAFMIYGNYTKYGNIILINGNSKISLSMGNSKKLNSDIFCSEFNVKFSVVENKNYFYYRFLYDSNFSLVYSYDNIYIFEFKKI